MYDTLMQMGRWFGYRPGYADLCRLYTSNELVSWYRHIALASDEMRHQFDQMVLERRTPKDYGLKVRSLPGVLQITAINKRRFAEEIELSYSDTLLETHTFSKDQGVYDRNFESTVDLLSSLSAPHRVGQHYVWSSVPAGSVIQFLRAYRSHPKQLSLHPDKLTEYIQRQVDNNTLTSWTVVLVSTTPKATGNREFELDAGGTVYRVNATVRNTDDETSAPEYRIKKGHIISPSHEALDLTDQEREEAETRSLAIRQAKWDKERERRERQGKEMTEPRPETVEVISGAAVRAVRPDTGALLLLYPLSPFEVMRSDLENAFDNTHPLMGYAISFPAIENDRKVTYLANAQYLEEYEYPAELDVQPEEEA